MFFLSKIFKLRDQANPEEEKPFLDHLEDLRIMVTRIVLTLLISTLVCFVYKDELMSIIRRPVEQVWVERHEATLPEDEEISLDDWENALTFAEVSAPLGQFDSELADRWWEKATDQRTRRLTEAAIVYRASLKIPEDDREDFIKSISDDQSEARELALKLLETKPADNLNAEGNLRLMSSLKPTETFMLTMKLAFFAGIVISFPFLLYFLLQFVVPGLKDEERKALWPALFIGFGLFLGGVLFAYFFVLPNVLTFFYEWGKDMGISNDWRIGYYISFATTFVLIFGLAFELPVVVMTLVKIGLLSHSMMRETRSYAILAIFVIAALITPTPDMMTLSLLAVPMVILYEICIWLSYFHEKKIKRLEEEEEKERMARLLSSPDGDPDTGPDGSPDPDPEIDPDPDHDPYHHDEYHDEHDPHYHPDHENMDLAEEGEHEDVSDDYMNYPGEHHAPEEDPNHDPLPEDDPDYDPLLPDEDLPDEEKDRK
ncbi:twin-arginine translocase subunit TatC [Akkermansiaceae bacterium]|nr:twin-arginine translocase subunit TatC [Akkermansiaceae bacterium]MDA7891816.1 twin-arginine translocase subunit TatC [Akkermansiaceae bacterium]MDA7907418.1 twin-arginine translocase subunit TatC [Akkermansiaceae bacterium]MDA7929239.1 twin-arginine translocase subunit TatC [Akkermansiaceae bacterium]MDA7933636.1 twin-arginine translocase subunit TatC [Akkermansiaceae bacterium]